MGALAPLGSTAGLGDEIGPQGVETLEAMLPKMVPLSEQRAGLLTAGVLGLGHQFLNQWRAWSSMGGDEASTQGQPALTSGPGAYELLGSCVCAHTRGPRVGSTCPFSRPFSEEEEPSQSDLQMTQEGESLPSLATLGKEGSWVS